MQRHDAIRCVCSFLVANLVANMGVRAIGGDVCAFAHQQLADSIHRFPEFESLSLRQFMPRRWGDARTSPQDLQ
jgi:hypothetical protein